MYITVKGTCPNFNKNVENARRTKWERAHKPIFKHQAKVEMGGIDHHSLARCSEAVDICHSCGPKYGDGKLVTSFEVVQLLPEIASPCLYKVCIVHGALNFFLRFPKELFWTSFDTNVTLALFQKFPHTL